MILQLVQFALLVVCAVGSSYAAYDAFTRRRHNALLEAVVAEKTANGKAQAKLEKRFENALGRAPNEQAKAIRELALGATAKGPE